MNCPGPFGSPPRSFHHEPRQCPWLSTTPSRCPSALCPATARTDQRCQTDVLVECQGLCLLHTRRPDYLARRAEIRIGPLAGGELNRISNQVDDDLPNAMSINRNLRKLDGKSTSSVWRLASARERRRSMTGITTSLSFLADATIEKVPL